MNVWLYYILNKNNSKTKTEIKIISGLKCDEKIQLTETKLKLKIIREMV